MEPLSALLFLQLLLYVDCGESKILEFQLEFSSSMLYLSPSIGLMRHICYCLLLFVVICYYSLLSVCSFSYLYHKEALCEGLFPSKKSRNCVNNNNGSTRWSGTDWQPWGSGAMTVKRTFPHIFMMTPPLFFWGGRG